MTTQYIIRTQPQALDMPDGPGWWAFVQNGGTSYERKDIASWNFFKTKGNQISLRWGDDTYTMRYTLEEFGNMYSNTKWYRLTMPWDTQHTITATVHTPHSVEESLRSIVPEGVEVAADSDDKWAGAIARPFANASVGAQRVMDELAKSHETTPPSAQVQRVWQVTPGRVRAIEAALDALSQIESETGVDNSLPCYILKAMLDEIDEANDAT